MAMDNGCIEVVVNTKKNTLMSFLKILLICLTACFVLIGLATGLWVAVIIGIATGVGAWFVSRNVNIEYEYSLVDRELRLAKIMDKSSRKSLGSYDLDKMEILAPQGSWHLDGMKNRQVAKTLDYSSHDPQEKGTKFELYIGDTKLLLTLAGEEAEVLLGAIRQFAPRKVFKD